MAAFTDELVDPLIGDMHGEEVIRMHENIFSKAYGMASQVAFQLTNRSSVPDAMPVDDPVSAPIKRKKVGENEGPQEQGYGPVRGGRQLVNAIGFDGETVRYVIGSVAAASSSAAVAVGSAAVEYVRTDGKDHLIHNLTETARRTAVGTGVVLNVAAGTASAAASGTGAVLNYAGGKMMANMTQEDYHELEAETMRVRHAQQTSAVVSQMHENAYQVQENNRLAVEAENQRKAEKAMALAQQQELDFRSAYSNAASVVSKTHGVGRRGNLNRSLQSRQPAQDYGVRNEPEGIGKKLVKGVGRGMTKVFNKVFPMTPGFEYM